MTKRIAYLLATAVFPMLILWFTFAPYSNAGGSTILIDAILYDGYENSDADEAVRLINVSGTAVNIGNWQLTDNTSTTSLPSSVTLADNATMWLADEATSFARQFGFLPDYELTDTDPTVPQLTGTWPGFANTGDEVVLMDNLSNIVDVLVYEGGDTGQTGWSGTAVQPYQVTGVFGADGQILYRMRDQITGQPVPDSNTAADWAQSTGDVINGRKVLYPGWDLDSYFQTTKFTESGTLTIAIAPDNAYETLKMHLDAAQSSIALESLTFENIAIANDIIAAANRGVNVTILLEGSPIGGVPDQEKHICQQIESAGGECWFMINDSDNDIHDRYRFLHAKFILIDGQQVIISSENLSPNSLPSDNKADGTWGRRGVMLVTDAPSVVAHVQSLFDIDFDLTNHVDITNTSSSLIGEPPAGFMPDLESGGITYTVRHPNAATFSGTFNYELVQSPENSLRDEDALLGLVGQAGTGDVVLVEQLGERPYWGASTSNATDDPSPRTEAYINAARNGASVQILLDALFDDGNATSNTATCAYVNGIAQAESLDLACKTGNPTGLGIHNKMVLVQIGGEGTLHVGSLNGSEQSSKGNRELALQVQSNEAYAYLADMFQRDWGATLYLPLVLNNYIAPATHILISEVLYNPGGTDDKEFIELVNPTNATIDLSNYSIGDAVNTTDFEDVRRFPAGTMLPPGQTIVVATAATAFLDEYLVNPDFEILNTNTAVPTLIDDPAWGDPATFLQLGNSGDEVILRDPTNQVIDVITYGTGSYPGITPCATVTTIDASLERFPYNTDTDDCSVDFREWAFPNPGSLP